MTPEQLIIELERLTIEFRYGAGLTEEEVDKRFYDIEERWRNN